MNRMTELLERINYDLPGLKKAKMCYAQGDADGAMDAVIEHFRTRTTPKYLFTAKEMEQCKVDGILEDAQETLDHYIYGHKKEPCAPRFSVVFSTSMVRLPSCLPKNSNDSGLLLPPSTSSESQFSRIVPQSSPY